MSISLFSDLSQRDFTVPSTAISLSPSLDDPGVEVAFLEIFRYTQSPVVLE